MTNDMYPHFVLEQCIIGWDASIRRYNLLNVGVFQKTPIAINGAFALSPANMNEFVMSKIRGARYTAVEDGTQRLMPKSDVYLDGDYLVFSESVEIPAGWQLLVYWYIDIIDGLDE